MLSTSNKEVYGTFRNYLEIYFMILAEALRKLQSAQPQRSTEKVPSIRFVCFWFSAFQRNAQPLPPAMISGVWGYVTNKH